MRYVGVVELSADTEFANPRDSDNLSMLALYTRRHNLPNDSGLRLDQFDSFEDLVAAIQASDGVSVIPVWMLEHSGATVLAGQSNPFNDPWDSGLVGVAYTTRERIDLMGTPEDRVEQCIYDEVKEYGRWMAGDVYSYTVYDTYTREEVEQIHGIIGQEWAEQEAASAADFWNKKEAS